MVPAGFLFASDDDLFSILGLLPGAVSPLGILNDDDKIVSFYVDKAFFCEPGLIGVHPNENTATVWLSPLDLTRIIEEHGNPVTLVSLD